MNQIFILLSKIINCLNLDLDLPSIIQRQHLDDVPLSSLTLKRKIEARLFEKKVSSGRPVEKLIAELDVLLQKLYNVLESNQYWSNHSQSNGTFIIKRMTHYSRLVKRLKHKTRLANTILRKSAK